MNVGIIIADSNGKYYVPATKGGAVTTLVEHIVNGVNNSNKDFLTVFCYYNKEAYMESKKYVNVKFKWIKVPTIFSVFDCITYKFVKKFCKNKKAISYKSIWSLLYFIMKCSRLLDETKFDKLILENNIPLAWIIKLSKYKGDFYYHLHNVPRINAKAKDIFEKCTGYLCVSDYVASEIESDNNPIGPIRRDKIKVVYNCINTKQFSKCLEKRELIRKQLNIASEQKVIIFTGRISKEKGVDILLDAIEKLENDVVVIIVGSLSHGDSDQDEFVKSIERRARALKQKIIFTGYVPQEKIAQYYNGADIAVLPSIWEEPAGLTMVEAMACETPVITTNSGGIPEYSNGHSILLTVDEDLANTIAQNINELFEGKIFIDTKSAGRYVKQMFDSDTYANKVLLALGD